MNGKPLADGREDARQFSMSQHLLVQEGRLVKGNIQLQMKPDKGSKLNIPFYQNDNRLIIL